MRSSEETSDRKKEHGDISTVPIFTTFKDRKECSQAWVHRPRFAGIDGNGRDGTYSIVLSGGYEDDEDYGEVIIYTGAGGKISWTDKRHIRDQFWNVHPNKALKRSYYTKKPIRVIRSSRSHSQYAPFEGLRYDGLYVMTKLSLDKGKSGFLVCRCQLERLPGQIPMSQRDHGPAIMGPSASVDTANGESVRDQTTEDDVSMRKGSGSN